MWEDDDDQISQFSVFINGTLSPTGETYNTGRSNVSLQYCPANDKLFLGARSHPEVAYYGTSGAAPSYEGVIPVAIDPRDIAISQDGNTLAICGQDSGSNLAAYFYDISNLASPVLLGQWSHPTETRAGQQIVLNF